MTFKGIGLFLMVGLFSILPLISIAQDDGNDPDKLGAPNIIKGGKSSTSKHKMSSQEKKLAKAKKKRMKEAAKAEKEAKKFHDKIQSKSTREMMKASKNKSDAWHDNKKVPWWKKIFRKKGRST